MKVELKICERCGAIWLRPVSSGWAYCTTCFPVVRSMVHSSSPRRTSPRCMQKAGAR